MEEVHYTFYAFVVNGHTAAIYRHADEALDELTHRLKEDSTDAYGIEPIEGIWKMLERLSEFEDRSDDMWMENVICMASKMIFDDSDKEQQLETKPPENKDSKK